MIRGRNIVWPLLMVVKSSRPVSLKTVSHAKSDIIRLNVYFEQV